MGRVDSDDDAGSHRCYCGERKSNATNTIAPAAAETQRELTEDALQVVMHDDEEACMTTRRPFTTNSVLRPLLRSDCLAIWQEMPNISKFQQFDEEPSRAGLPFQPPSVLLAKFAAEEHQAWCKIRRNLCHITAFLTVVLLALILGFMSVAYLVNK
jgi:hypothetical protein